MLLAQSSVKKSAVKFSALGLTCCALLLAAPLALAQSAAADGPRNEQEAAACRGVVSVLLPALAPACAVQPEDS